MGFFVALQDLGAAGLTSSSSEMASARAALGLRIDLDLVPLRETSMAPAEILVSESQERMLAVVEPHRRRRPSSRSAASGSIWTPPTSARSPTATGSWRSPGARSSSTSPPTCWQTTRPCTRSRRTPAPAPAPLDLATRPAARRSGRSLARAARHARRSRASAGSTSSTTTSSAPNTVRRPGGDAAVVRLPGTDRAIAAHHRLRRAPLPARSARGRRGGGVRGGPQRRLRRAPAPRPSPTASTSPTRRRAHTGWRLAQAIAGMSDACRALGTPVVSGNVSLYNESAGADHLPDAGGGHGGTARRRGTQRRARLPQEGDVVLLVGRRRAATRRQRVPGPRRGPPRAAGRRRSRSPSAGCSPTRPTAGLLVSAHDVAAGGHRGGARRVGDRGRHRGAAVELPDAGRRQTWRCSASAGGRVVVSCAQADEDAPTRAGRRPPPHVPRHRRRRPESPMRTARRGRSPSRWRTQTAPTNRRSRRHSRERRPGSPQGGVRGLRRRRARPRRLADRVLRAARDAAPRARRARASPSPTTAASSFSATSAWSRSVFDESSLRTLTGSHGASATCATPRPARTSGTTPSRSPAPAPRGIVALGPQRQPDQHRLPARRASPRRAWR